MRLSKEQSRERMQQLRALWNEWDPIGIGDLPANDDEYSTYAGKSMRFLETNARAELVEYLRWAVSDNMALEFVDDASIEQFATKMQQWFADSWAGTHA